MRQSLELLFLTCAVGAWWAWGGYRSEALWVGTVLFGTVGLTLALVPGGKGYRRRWGSVGRTAGLVAGTVGISTLGPTALGTWVLWGVAAALWGLHLYLGMRLPLRFLAELERAVSVVPGLMALTLGLQWAAAWHLTFGAAGLAAGALWVVAWVVRRCGRAWYQRDLTSLPAVARGGAYFLRPLWRSHGIVYLLLSGLSTWNVLLRREWLAAVLWTLLMGTYMVTLWTAQEWSALRTFSPTESGGGSHSADAGN